MRADMTADTEAAKKDEALLDSERIYHGESKKIQRDEMRQELALEVEY